MNSLKITLAADGMSDKILLSLIEWITSSYDNVAFNRIAFICSPGQKLQFRIPQALEKEPCDILIVHRDAENESYDLREDEISSVFTSKMLSQTFVCLIPIKMTESWFLHSPAAIRMAAGKQASKVQLNLPSIKNIEFCDAKKTLEDALKTAGELSGRRLRNFDFHECRHSVARYIDDFSALRELQSFTEFEKNLRKAIDTEFLKKPLTLK
jgi:hypothetical protein